MSMNDEEDNLELRIKEMETSINLQEMNKIDKDKGGSGDVNNDGFVTEGDSKQILDFLVGKGTLEDDNIKNAKVTPGNDDIGLIDIITIQREINNLTNKVNNIVPVSLENKSINVDELTGNKLNFKEIIAKKLDTDNFSLRGADIGTSIEDLSKSLLKLKKLQHGKDASFNTIMSESLEIIKGKLIVNKTDVLKELEGKQDRLKSSSIANMGSLFVKNTLRIKEKDVYNTFNTIDKKFEAVDQSMNKVFSGGVLDVKTIEDGWKAADEQIYKDLSSAIAGTVKLYDQVLDNRHNLDLQHLTVVNGVSGNELEFVNGYFSGTVTMKELNVGGVPIYTKIKELDQAVDAKVFEATMIDPETDLSLNSLTVANLNIRIDPNQSRGPSYNLLRKIKDLDESVEILKQSMGVVMKLLSDFLRES